MSNLNAFDRGHTTLKEKTLKELEQTFQELQSKFEEINQNAIRDKKSDLPTINQNELNQILKSKTTTKQKTQTLLTQIGYLRINMFGEFFEQIQLAQKNNTLDKAVKLMNNCGGIVAVPFISTRKKAPWTKRLKEAISGKKTPEPAKYVQEWKAGYEAWFKQNESGHLQADDKKRMGEFEQLKTAFITLYTYSFSVEDFPPLRNRRSDH
jgi:hypothetical protein